jgi:hypothetical protein
MPNYQVKLKDKPELILVRDAYDVDLRTCEDDTEGDHCRYHFFNFYVDTGKTDDDDNAIYRTVGAFPFDLVEYILKD